MQAARRISILLMLIGTAGCAERRESATVAAQGTKAPDYPAHWWTPVPESEAASWEILPQAAGPGEVIVSKRNELGVLSNFAATPFTLHGQRYASLEGFWQMMKYPVGAADPRATFPGIIWPHTRAEVAAMVGHEAKAAGDAGTRNMKAMGIDWVTFEGRKMVYHTPEKGAHYALIVAAMREKVRQNPQVRRVLLATGDLILRPDHHQPDDAPPAWRYCTIMRDIRADLQKARE